MVLLTDGKSQDDAVAAAARLKAAGVQIVAIGEGRDQNSALVMLRQSQLESELPSDRNKERRRGRAETAGV